MYARLDDNMPDHPKVARLSDRAFRLYVSALCYAARYRTDGLVPTSVAPRLTAGASKRHVEELLSAGLWDRQDDGVQIHDFLQWNISRDQDRAQRQSARKAARRRWGTDA